MFSWGRKSRELQEKVDGLVFMVEALNARELALLHFLVDTGSLSATMVNTILSSANTQDVERMIINKLRSVAQSEVSGDNLSFSEFNR